MRTIDLSVKAKHDHKNSRALQMRSEKSYKLRGIKHGQSVKSHLESILSKASHAASGLVFFRKFENTIENWLSEERDQLPVWIPAGLAIGITIWELLGDIALRQILLFTICLFLLGCINIVSRWSAVLRIAAISISIGYFGIYAKSAYVAAPALQETKISVFYGRIVKVEQIAARQKVRLLLETGSHAGLPPKVRVNLTTEHYRPEFVSGAIIKLRARLVPPAGPSLPGAYDFARRAWFAEIGATGTALGPVQLHRKSLSANRMAGARAWITERVTEALPGDSGAIALALVTGDQGQISQADADAMRNSGLAHLLSISGLHVTAVVGAIFLLVSRLLALFPYFALRQTVPIYAAAAAAIAAIAYTLLTGAQVPTVRSCIAALMILTALALGRDAISLRLIAFGATIILLFWPEALAGPSFQLSFAAVATIIVLHDSVWMRNLAERLTGEGFVKRVFGGLFSLLITGIAIELVLAPIALFHFHKTGLYGALANIVAIPLTTFIIMPFEALGLIFDLIGFGAPFWWVAGQGISAILWIAHYVSALPGAVAMFPAMPNWAFACIVIGIFWCGVLKSQVRWMGVLLCLVGGIGIFSAPYPDILVTGDGKHLAITNDSGEYTILRSKAGDYVRDTLKENAGINAEPIAIEDWTGANCSLDTCIISLSGRNRDWTIMALRTRYAIPAMELSAACRRVDIVISDRWLPYSCKPRWLKADRNLLEQTGGLAFYLDESRVSSVAAQSPNSPWTTKANQK
jgi:competence protein ComEC